MKYLKPNINVVKPKLLPGHKENIEIVDESFNLNKLVMILKLTIKNIKINLKLIK